MMNGLLNQIKDRIFSSVQPEAVPNIEKDKEKVDNLISLGVLLWVVAEADKKFLPEETAEIQQILCAYGNISDEDISIVLRAVREAALDRIDLFSFTKEISPGLAYKAKVGIIENLFRVACADRQLDHSEHEMIRKISGLLGVDHKDFINSKGVVKKELNINMEEMIIFDHINTPTLSEYLGKNFNKDVAYTIRCGGRRSPINGKHNWDGYIVDGEEYRLTINDCLLLQGFHDTVLYGSTIKKFKLLGNTIPTNLTGLIYQKLEAYFNKNKLKVIKYDEKYDTYEAKECNIKGQNKILNPSKKIIIKNRPLKKGERRNPKLFQTKNE